MKPFLAALTAIGLGCCLSANAADKKLLLIAGSVSHGPGDHEFRAGTLLLQKGLANVPGLDVEVHFDGWPESDTAFEGADAVVIYADGGGGHPAIQKDRIALIDSLVEKGVGVGCMHYGVEVPTGAPQEAMWRWIGGHYEHEYSVNPMWQPIFKAFPNHAVANGVGPFALEDEWYFNMRWRPDGKGLVHLLVDKPSHDVRDGPYVHPRGPYDHIVNDSGREETMMWLYERPDGGRGFGFTGGHKHINWYDDNQRKIVLNALLWVTGMEVPAGGVQSEVTPEEMSDNLEPKRGLNELAKVTGDWDVTVSIGGREGDLKFSLIQAGQNLVGLFPSGDRRLPVKGSVNGKKVEFQVSIQHGDQLVTAKYSGEEVAPGELEGSLELGTSQTASWRATLDK